MRLNDLPTSTIEAAALKAFEHLRRAGLSRPIEIGHFVAIEIGAPVTAEHVADLIGFQILGGNMLGVLGSYDNEPILMAAVTTGTQTVDLLDDLIVRFLTERPLSGSELMRALRIKSYTAQLVLWESVFRCQGMDRIVVEKIDESAFAELSNLKIKIIPKL